MWGFSGFFTKRKETVKREEEAGLLIGLSAGPPNRPAVKVNVSVDVDVNDAKTKKGLELFNTLKGTASGLWLSGLSINELHKVLNGTSEIALPEGVDQKILDTLKAVHRSTSGKDGLSRKMLLAMLMHHPDSIPTEAVVNVIGKHVCLKKIQHAVKKAADLEDTTSVGLQAHLLADTDLSWVFNTGAPLIRSHLARYVTLYFQWCS
jgi:hypothetical protein